MKLRKRLERELVDLESRYLQLEIRFRDLQADHDQCGQKLGDWREPFLDPGDSGVY